MPFWRTDAGGVSVMVKVQPKSRRPGLQGVTQSADGERLRVGVSEPAEGGRANRAACQMLAQELDVPVSAVSVAAGAASREKRLYISGDPAALTSRLAEL
jgi:uncharacterized protein